MILQRKLFPDIEGHLNYKEYSIITGARQVGKTSLLRLLFSKLTSQQKNAFYLSLEDPKVLTEVDSHPEKILNFLTAKPKPILEEQQAEPIFLLIDEVQYANDPTNLLKYLYDRYESNLKVVATGSSAFYIDKKFKDSLAGRKRIFQLHPLTFEEFLQFQEDQIWIREWTLLRENPEYISVKEEGLRTLFFEYLTYGGYPAVVLERNIEEKKYRLAELKNSYIKRDMLESGVDKEQKFYLLLQLLAEQTGSLMNKHELSVTVGVDAKTIDHYLYVLQKCFHVELVRPFFRNIRKELTKMPKVYLNDLGLRNSLLNRFSELPDRADKGQLLENYFYLQLRDAYSADQIRFWRTTQQQEVDFVVEERFGEGKAFEIKWNKSAFSPSKYRSFLEAYPSFPLRVLGSEDFIGI